MSQAIARLLTALLLVIVVTPTASAGPREELLRHVPDDIGFCLILDNLRDHSTALEQSPFAEFFRQSAAGKALLQPDDLKQLQMVHRYAEKILGISLEKLRDDILGDGVLFAYRPGPPGKPEQEQGLLLLRARNERLLIDLVNRLNKLQKDRGDVVRLEDLEHNGIKYVRRVERGDKPPTYYCLDGSMLLFGQEKMLQQALDQGRQKDESVLMRRLRQSGSEGALLTLWVNPRAFDAEVAARVGGAAANEERAVRTFATWWKALDGLTLSVRLDGDLSVELALQGRRTALPPALRQLLTEGDKPSELWPVLPENALLATAGRVDPVAILEVLGELLPRDQRDTLLGDLNRMLGDPIGRDFIKELLPQIGPDWGLCVLAPAPADKAWFPQTTLAIRVGKGPEEAPADRALLEALSLYAGLAVVGQNSANPGAAIVLKKVILDKREIKYLSGDKVFPSGLQPAFALHGGFLLLGSSPEAVQRMALPQPATVHQPPAAIPLLRISVKDLRAYLKERREPLADYVAAQEKLPGAEVRARLDRLIDILELIDRVEVSQRSTTDQMIFSLKVRPARPLKK
jgi:hypothetical protein